MRRLTALSSFVLCSSVALMVRADGGDVCAAPTVIMVLPYTDNGSTIGKTNNIASVPYACNGFYETVNGPDVVYQITFGPPPNNATISVDPTGANWDPSIYVLTDCNDGNTCGLDRGSDFVGPNGTEVVTLTDVPAGTYFIYVDSFYSSANTFGAGTYMISVTGNLNSVGAAPIASDGTLTTNEDVAGTTAH